MCLWVGYASLFVLYTQLFWTETKSSLAEIVVIDGFHVHKHATYLPGGF